MTATQTQTIFPTEADIPNEYALPAPINQREYLVDGALLTWTGEVKEVYSPVAIRQADGTTVQKLLGSYPLLSPEESVKALEAAARAYDQGRGFWPNLRVAERIKYMEQFVAGMRTVRNEVVNLLMWEIGKSLKDSQKEFDRTVDYILQTINTLKQQDRDNAKFVIEEGIIAQIRRSPYGVALCMGPYNYPLNETFATMIPAMIMGNTVVFKPARYGVLLLKPFLQLFREIFPKGVINVIYGEGRSTAGAVMATGKVSLFAFIGTHKASNDIKRQHPKPNRLRSVLGLDAKNPGIVLANADLELAAKECVLGALSFNGQRCTALKILFVHKSVAAKFIELVVKEVEKLKLGMPWDKDVAITPLPEPGKVEFLRGLVTDAINKGARVMNAGGGESDHTLYTPAVVYPVQAGMQLYDVEQFGPVVPIAEFEEIDEVLDYCVESEFGQQVSIFGKDPEQVAHLLDPLVNQVGRVNLNSQSQRGPDTFPFNGRKDSAEATLSVTDALRVFSLRTLVAAKESDANKELLTRIVREHKSSFLSTDYLF